jgi:hypothetical protein
VKPLYGRFFGSIYLTSWTVTLIGIVLGLSQQSWAYAVFVPGAVTSTAFAFVLAGRAPEAPGRAELLPFNLRSWQVTWYRVMFGVELPRAWRAVRRVDSHPKISRREAYPKSRQG